MKLELHDVSKRYDDNWALIGFSKVFHEGVYALLGENGAGKSTLINVLVGLIPMSSGEIYFDDEDVFAMGARFRKIIGYMPQTIGYYPEFTAKQFLTYIGRMKGLSKKEVTKKCEILLQEVNLYERADKKIKTFSGGMKQRLGLASAIIGNPKILILDEPTAGLDIKERVNFRNLISRLSNNMIVIYCTHIASDVEMIAKEVIFLRKGQLISEESVVGESIRVSSNLEDKYLKMYGKDNNGDKI